MVTGNSEGERVSKAKVFKEKYKAKLEFLEELGGQTIEPCMGEVWIFSKITHLGNVVMLRKP